jgi:hypothetical protein
MTKGFVKLYRNFTEWGWYSNLKTKALFLHLLIRANWKPGEFEGERIERGELVTSLDSLRIETRLTVGEIRTALAHLKKTGEIRDRSTNSYRIITIVNYNKYQDGEADSTSDPGQDEYEKKAVPVRENRDPETDDSHSVRKPAAYEDQSDFIRPATIEEYKECNNYKKERTEEVLYDPSPEGQESDLPSEETGRVVEAWNELETVGINRISKLIPGTRRCQDINERIREYGIDAVLSAIERIRKSDFLRGVNKGNWVISFDWFVRPDNFIKVLEGNYDRRSAVIADLDISWLEK